MALEIESLAQRHPNVGLLAACGISTYVRLTLDPCPQPPGKIQRPVGINWKRCGAEGQAIEASREVGWANLPPSILKSAVLWTHTKNEQTITEEGAIGVIALLVHDLEQVSIRTIVPIGGGGDYYVELAEGKQTQLECSGIRIDRLGSDSRARLTKRSEQVLQKSEDGFAAVVAFSHGSEEEIHCYLHFVASTRKTKRKGKESDAGGTNGTAPYRRSHGQEG